MSNKNSISDLPKTCSKKNSMTSASESKEQINTAAGSADNVASTVSGEFESKFSVSLEVDSNVESGVSQCNSDLECNVDFLHELTDDPSKCLICINYDPNVTSRFHFRLTVHGSENHECEFCKKIFHCKFYLSDHKVQNHGQNFYERCECSIIPEF